MRVLLIATYDDRSPSPLNPGKLSLALLTLKAWLESHHSGAFEVHIRAYHRESLNRFSWLGDLAAIRPDVIGFSCYFWNFEAILRAARAIRLDLKHDAPIILGGTHVSSRRFARAVLDANPEVDFIVRGEGEETLTSLLEAIRCSNGVEAIPGITFRDGNRIRETADAPSRFELDEIPMVFCERHEVELRDAMSHDQVSYQTYRGCRQRCKFCCYNASSMRFFGMDRVEQELRYILSEMKPRFLRILDSHLGGSRKRAIEILEILAEHNQRTQVQVFHDVRHVDDEYLQVCERANALTLWSGQEFGLQSSCEPVLENIDRRGEVDAFRRALTCFQDYADRRGHALEAVAEYMIGLPADTFDSFLETLVCAMTSGARHVRSFPLLVLPGTALFEEAEALGVSHFMEGNFQVLSTPTLTAEEIQRAIHLARFVEAIDKILPQTYRALCRAGVGLAELLQECFDRYLAHSFGRDSEWVYPHALIGSVRESFDSASALAPSLRVDLLEAVNEDLGESGSHSPRSEV